MCYCVGRDIVGWLECLFGFCETSFFFLYDVVVFIFCDSKVDVFFRVWAVLFCFGFFRFFFSYFVVNHGVCWVSWCPGLLMGCQIISESVVGGKIEIVSVYCGRIVFQIHV